MAKNKSIFICQECGYESNGWLGKCPACNQWSTLVEETRITGGKTKDSSVPRIVTPISINDIEIGNEERFYTGIPEMDRVLGGGIVKGSLILVGGDPGIGKSTLILQICNGIAVDENVLYISGEESVRQIKMRADRLKVNKDKLLMVSETDFSVIEILLSEIKPRLVIIDSIQTMFTGEISSAPGSVGQVREVTAKLMRIAKTLSVAIILIGHVTKEGNIAGPRVLEHMVDTVLYFEGERHQSYRILRAVKNRFGSTNEIGIFEMKEIGLVEVENPSAIMLSGRPINVSGSVVVSALEGTRTMLVEIQALVCPTVFGMPRRMATGLDYNRITLLMAVLEKKVGLQLSNYDAYVNVVGGIKLDEPACDLGIIAAIASSFRNKAIDVSTVFIGEVGLTGEVRSVSQIDKRISEAMRIGFKTCVIPMGNYSSLSNVKELSKMTIKPIENVREIIDMLL